MESYYLFLLGLVLALATLISSQPQPVVYNTLINGQPTMVSSDAIGAPTMWYNCAKMPAICGSLARVYPTNGPGVTNLLGTSLQGTLQANDIALHYDTDPRNRKARNKAAGCVSRTWQKRTTCPDNLANYPGGVPVVVARNGCIGRNGVPRLNAFYAQKWTAPPAGLQLTKAGINAIADLNNVFQQLVWTCEEFPPAM